MFISNSRAALPPSVSLNNVDVLVVKEFKLLDVTIDHKLNFDKRFCTVREKKVASLLIENSIDTILRELSEVFEMQV